MSQPETPPAQYYPSAKLRIAVRFEDYGADDVPQPPALPPQLRSGKKSVDKPLSVSKADGVFLLESSSGDTQPGGPQKQSSSRDGRTHWIEGVIPDRATLKRSGVKQGDTLSLDVRFMDLPFDPRVIRAAAVEFYLGTFREEDFRRGAEGTSQGETSNALEPLNVIPDSFVDANGIQRSNLRFSGWVDDWQVEYGEGTEAMAIIECIDNSRLLTDQGAPSKLSVSDTQPIDEAIANYLSNFPQFIGFSIEYRPASAEVPKLRDALAKTAYKAAVGPTPAGGAGKLKVWDYLTDICGTIGHILRFEGTTIIIQRPRTYYQTAGVHRRPDDPFRTRTLPSGRKIDDRLWIYGRNVTDMRLGRKFSKFAPSNVEVRCYSPKLKRTLVARYPLKGDRQTSVSPGESADQKWNVHQIQGVSDEKTLRVYAQGVYEARGRNEFVGQFATRDLASYGGSNEDPDALDMQAGDTVDLALQRDPEFEGSTEAIENDVGMRAAAFLRSLGFSREISAAYATAIANKNLQTKFRIKDVVMDWAKDGGVTIDANVSNYLEIRSDKELPPGEEQ